MQRRHRAILAGLAALAPALAPPAFAAGECPAPADLEKSVKQVFKRDITVKGVAPSQLKGLCEVQVSFQGRPNILYADSTGAFFVTGHLIDAKGGLDLTEESLAALNSFSPEDNIIGSRIVYTKTPRMFGGALIQYQSAVKTVTSNVRLRWEYRQPGSELFVVYSDGRDTDDTGFPPPILNRSIVVKLTKLFRM